MPKPMVKGPNSIIPDGEPDPEMEAQVRAIMGFDKPKKPAPPEMAASLPDGLSEAPMPEPRQEIKLPPPTVIMHERQPDETVPAFANIRRMTEADLTQMPWLITRLKEHWPDVALNSWYSRLRVYMHDNGYLFVRNDRAVALAFVARNLFDLRPWVAPVFVLHADRDRPIAEDEGGAKDAIALVREIVRWAKTMGASEVRDLQIHCDISPGRLQHLVSGERRDEIFVKLK
jgi:hypothetical protein